jgi:hypothetical protein
MDSSTHATTTRFGGATLIRDPKSRKWHVESHLDQPKPKRVKVANTSDAAEIALNWEAHDGVILRGLTPAFDKALAASS